MVEFEDARKLHVFVGIWKADREYDIVMASSIVSVTFVRHRLYISTIQGFNHKAVPGVLIKFGAPFCRSWSRKLVADEIVAAAVQIMVGPLPRAEVTEVAPRESIPRKAGRSHAPLPSPLQDCV